MIEPTDEMISAFRGVLADGEGYRKALAAVLDIVERDYAIGPVSCLESAPGEPLAFCELAMGHKGKHTATVEKAVDW